MSCRSCSHMKVSPASIGTRLMRCPSTQPRAMVCPTRAVPGVSTACNNERHAVDFDAFFSCVDGTTPEKLLRAGIYEQIAIALKGGPWRRASLVMIAKVLSGNSVAAQVVYAAAASSAWLGGAMKYAASHGLPFRAPDLHRVVELSHLQQFSGRGHLPASRINLTRSRLSRANLKNKMPVVRMPKYRPGNGPDNRFSSIVLQARQAEAEVTARGSSSTTTMPAAATVPADIVDVLIEVKSSEAVEQPVDDETADLETMQLELAEIEAKLAAAKEEAAKEEALRT